MDFELNEEQAALQSSLARLLAQQHGHEERRRIAESASGWSEPLWRQLAELGVTALPVPERYGGLGGTASDLFAVMQEVGRSLLATPLVHSCVLPAAALRSAADEAVQQAWLPALAEGRSRLVWAHDEAEGDGGPQWLATRARRDGNGWRLDGRKVCVPFGGDSGGADAFLVTARLQGEPGASDGRALFVVRPSVAGFRWREYRLTDLTPAGELLLDGAAAEPACLAAARAATGIDAAWALGIGCACAEMLGAMETAFRLTVDYLGTRRQFGRAIGQNQALRHALADMQVSLELARSMAIAAAVQAERVERVEGASDDAEARADLHRAKLVLGRHARALAQSAIQLHGGIGMTEEYAVGHVLRRVHVLDQRHGDPSHHAAALAAAAIPAP